MSTKPTVRCPFTRLTKPQVNAISSVLYGSPIDVPHGVWRSLVMRGILGPEGILTDDGKWLFGRCSFLSEKMRTALGKSWRSSSKSRTCVQTTNQTEEQQDGN